MADLVRPRTAPPRPCRPAAGHASCEWVRVSQMSGWPFRCQCGDQCRIWTEEKVAECQTPPIGNPALRQMVRPIVQHVAARQGQADFSADCWWDRCQNAPLQARRASSGTELPPQGRANGQDVHGDRARSPFVRRTSARPAGSGGGRDGVGHSAGTFLRRARSGRGCSIRASAEDRVVATPGGLAWLCRPLFPKHAIDACPANAEPSRISAGPSFSSYRSLWTTAESIFGFRPL